MGKVVLAKKKQCHYAAKKVDTPEKQCHYAAEKKPDSNPKIRQFLVTFNDENIWSEQKIKDSFVPFEAFIKDSCLCSDVAPTTGKKHWHLGLWLNIRKTLNVVKSWFPGANVSIDHSHSKDAMSNWRDIIAYICDSEHEHGELKTVILRNKIIPPAKKDSKNKKKENFLNKLQKIGIDSFQSEVEKDWSLIRYQQNVLKLETMQLNNIHFSKEFLLSIPEPVWIFVYGETGSGKTFTCEDILFKLAKKGIRIQQQSIDLDGKLLNPKEIGINGYYFNEFSWKGFFKNPYNILNLSDPHSISRGFGVNFISNCSFCIFNSINPPQDSMKDLEEDYEKWKTYIAKNRNIVAEFIRRVSFFVHCKKVDAGPFGLQWALQMTDSKNLELDLDDNWIEKISTDILTRTTKMKEWIKENTTPIDSEPEGNKEEDENIEDSSITPPGAPIIEADMIHSEESEEGEREEY